MPSVLPTYSIMNLINTLKDYGLSQKQAQIYLACLELGSSSVQKIGQKSNIARSTCYEVLESLKKRKLISTFKKRKVNYYSAEDPQKAIGLAREKVRVLEEALPQFRAIYGESKVMPTVRFYQGKEGMKIIFQEILDEAKKEILNYGSAQDLIEVMGSFWDYFLKERAKKKILARVILWESETAHQRKKLGQKELREVKIIPAEYKHHGQIVVWSDKVAMFSFKKDLTALVIESKEIAGAQKSAFNYIWNSN